MKVGVGIIAVLLGLAIVVRPFVEKVHSLKLRMDLSMERLDLYEKTETARAKLEKLEGFFLTMPERSLVLGKIADIASREKVDIEGMTPKTAPGPYYLKLFVDVNTKGSFFPLIQFLKHVDSFNPAIRINGVTVTRAPVLFRNKREGELQTIVYLETYLKPKVKKSNAQ